MKHECVSIHRVAWWTHGGQTYTVAERSNSAEELGFLKAPIHMSLELAIEANYKVEVLQKSFEELKQEEENIKHYEEKLKVHGLTMEEEMVKEANAKIA
ncbi:hypothetical protein Tco_0727794 [Tanacetum coccineum]|uniref:Uncharacterized protein n=1 Tax=Tanacetum coccineum TaxID=301880 RepID=A0ABQ4YMD3_9ASTR